MPELFKNGSMRYVRVLISVQQKGSIATTKYQFKLTDSHGLYEQWKKFFKWLVKHAQYLLPQQYDGNILVDSSLQQR